MGEPTIIIYESFWIAYPPSVETSRLRALGDDEGSRGDVPCVRRIARKKVTSGTVRYTIYKLYTIYKVYTSTDLTMFPSGSSIRIEKGANAKKL